MKTQLEITVKLLLLALVQKRAVWMGQTRYTLASVVSKVLLFPLYLQMMSPSGVVPIREEQLLDPIPAALVPLVLT